MNLKLSKATTLLIFLVTFLTTVIYSQLVNNEPAISGAPPIGEAEKDVPTTLPWEEIRKNWKRPEGPPKVALQVGHLHNDEVPEELKKLKGNTGASADGHDEVDVNLVIAEKTAEILRSHGVSVDILPATVPPDYFADAFIAIHADGSTDSSVSGFKIASPWRDLSGNATSLVKILEENYANATNLAKDPNITRNMRGYYAFSWWRYEHSIHPMTTAVIVETGFLTNRKDRKLIAETPSVPAEALAEGVMKYLDEQGLVQYSG